MFSETNMYEIINSLVDSFNVPFNRNSNVGGIMLFLPEDKPAKLIASKHLLVYGLYVDVKLRKQKQLISSSYNPNKSIKSQHMEALGKILTCISQLMRTLFS